MNRLNIRFALLATLSLLLVGSAIARGQAVGISSPSHGELLLDTSAFYRGAPNYDVEVRGFAGIPKGQKNKYAVLVQGQLVKVKGKAGGLFKKRIWVGPWPGPGGPPPPWYPYLRFFTDPQHIQKPIIVELLYKPTKTVVSRDRVVLFDGRFDGQLNPKFGGTSLDDAMYVQIPASGLDALERTHLTSLPHPTLAEFNEVLRDKAIGTELEIETETGPGNSDKACIPLTDTGTTFLLSPSFVAVFAQAEARYVAYQEVQDTQSFVGVGGIPGAIVALGLQAYLTGECVQKQPDLSTFEVCVGRIEAEITDLSTTGILDANLSFGPGVLDPSHVDDILADVNLGSIDATLDGRLRDVFIRWSERPSGCSPTFLPLPKQTLSDTELLDTEDRAAWATCPNLEADAAAAHLGPTTDGPFHVDPLAFDANSAHFGLDVLPDPETLHVLGAAGVSFTLDAARTQNPDAGTCAETFVNAKVKELLGRFYPAIENAIEETWDDGASDTQQARALDDLLSPLEVGTYEPVDHALDLDYTSLDALGTAFTVTPPYDGLVGIMRTDAHLRAGFAVLTPPTTWIYSPPGSDVLNSDPTGTRPYSVSTDGRDYFHHRFDIAFGLTSGTLNQVLRERSAADWMRFEWQPTWGDLGLAAPPGSALTDPAKLTGALLAPIIHPGLASLGNATLTVLAQPTLLPFTWIPPDPMVPGGPPYDDGRAPLTYQLSQFTLDFYSDDPANPHPIRLLVDFYDGAFAFGFGAPASNLLVPTLGSAEWTMTSLDWNVPGCDRAPMTAPIAGTPTCGGLLVSALYDVFVPILQDRMLGMLADVPAPLRFDAAGRGVTKDVSLSDTYVGHQRVILYGRLQ
jgi:hypothetical protein